MTFVQEVATGSIQNAFISVTVDQLVEGTENLVVSGNVTPPASFVPGGDTVTVDILDSDGECG